jgi:hypothetical protein
MIADLDIPGSASERKSQMEEEKEVVGIKKPEAKVEEMKMEEVK